MPDTALELTAAPYLRGGAAWKFLPNATALDTYWHHYLLREIRICSTYQNRRATEANRVTDAATY